MMNSALIISSDLNFTDEELNTIDRIFNIVGKCDLFKNDLINIQTNLPVARTIFSKLLDHSNSIKEFILNNFDINTQIGNFGLRNERGRIVEKEGHFHELTDSYFTSISTIYGPGPWMEIDGKREVTKEGESVIFVEKLLLEDFPNLNVKPLLHGSPTNSKKRLIFLCSFLPD